MYSTIKEASTCNGSTKRRGTREGSENISRELTARNFPNVFYSTHTHTNPRSSVKIKTRRKSWKQQEKGNSFCTNVPQQINSWLLIRYHRGHKAAWCHMQSAERKKKSARKKRKKNCQLKILFPERVSFKNEDEINIFSDKQKKTICCYQTLLCKNIKYSG